MPGFCPPGLCGRRLPSRVPRAPDGCAAGEPKGELPGRPVDDGRRYHRDASLLRDAKGGVAELVDDARNTLRHGRRFARWRPARTHRPDGFQPARAGTPRTDRPPRAPGARAPRDRRRLGCRSRSPRLASFRSSSGWPTTRTASRVPDVVPTSANERSSSRSDRLRRCASSTATTMLPPCRAWACRAARVASCPASGAAVPGASTSWTSEAIVRVQERRDAAPEHAPARRFHVAGHSAQDRRLPGSGLAGQDDQAGERLDRSEEIGARTGVKRTRVKGIRVRGVREPVPTGAEWRVGHR